MGTLPRLEQYPVSELNEIRSKWKSMTDRDLSIILKCCESRVQNMRLCIGLNRDTFRVTTREMVAVIIEMFANGNTVTYIAKRVGRSDSTISGILNRHYMTKRKSNCTKVIILQSKINGTK